MWTFACFPSLFFFFWYSRSCLSAVWVKVRQLENSIKQKLMKVTDGRRSDRDGYGDVESVARCDGYISNLQAVSMTSRLALCQFVWIHALAYQAARQGRGRSEQRLGKCLSLYNAAREMRFWVKY